MKKSFLQDVLDQPAFLREAINNYPVNDIDLIKTKIELGELKKIVLTGHGSSYNSLYPSFLKLSSLLTPVALWQTAELVHYGLQQIDSDTLLIVNSQSGRSAEVAHLVEKVSRSRPGMLLAFTNEPQSALGSQSDIIIKLLAGEEHGVATKTYMNALCLSSLLAAQLCGEDINGTLKAMLSACDEMQAYLANWEDKVEEIDTIFGKISNVMVIGRGPSMASALNAALNQKEAAWLFTEGMNAAEFRHGPLELADENMKLIVMEGDRTTSRFNSMMAEEVHQYGGDVLWIGNQPPAGIKNIHFPEVADNARPLIELLPLQLLAYLLANRKNMEAGKFRHIGKVVMKE